MAAQPNDVIFEAVVTTVSPGGVPHVAPMGVRYLPGLVVPTWADVQSSDFQPWDVTRDGDRLIVDGADQQSAVEHILAAVAPH